MGKWWSNGIWKWLNSFPRGYDWWWLIDDCWLMLIDDWRWFMLITLWFHQTWAGKSPNWMEVCSQENQWFLWSIFQQFPCLMTPEGKKIHGSSNGSSNDAWWSVWDHRITRLSRHLTPPSKIAKQMAMARHVWKNAAPAGNLKGIGFGTYRIHCLNMLEHLFMLRAHMPIFFPCFHMISKTLFSAESE